VAKRKKQKKFGQVPSEVSARLNQAVGELIGRLPGDDPLALFESVTGDRAEDKFFIFEILAGYRSPEVLNFLHRLTPTLKDKSLAKAARRTIYRLEQSGLRASEEVKPAKKSILRPLSAKRIESYATAYQDYENRTSLLALPAPGGGFNGGLFLVSQSEGLLDIKTMYLSGGELNRLVRLFDQFGKMIEIPAGHGRFILTEAAALTRDLGRELPKEYEEFTTLTGQPPLPDRPAIYEYLTPDETMAAMSLEQVADRLLDHELFAGLVLVEELASYFQQMDELEDSKIILSEIQKEERRKALFEQAGARIFNGPKRAVLKRQLEETALLLWQENEKILAEAALATALDLDREPSPLRPHYFTQALLRRSIDLIYDQVDRVEESERRSRRIILPNLDLGWSGLED